MDRYAILSGVDHYYIIERSQAEKDPPMYRIACTVSGDYMRARFLCLALENAPPEVHGSSGLHPTDALGEAIKARSAEGSPQPDATPERSQGKPP